MWKWLSPFFMFTTNERKTVVLLLFACTVFVFLFNGYSYFIASTATHRFETKDAEVLAFLQEYEETYLAELANDTNDLVDLNHTLIENSTKNNRDDYTKRKVYTLFPFDPNKIGEKEWADLGLSEKQAAVVENYKAKGGKFRSAEDIRKIKVISPTKADELIPYITIASLPQESKWTAQSKSVYPERQKVELDINQADSTAFDLLRGIGPSLARRIVSYRERLGGFVAVAQVAEVWGLQDSTYQMVKDKLTITEGNVRKLNLNTADVEQIKSHPYFNYYHAKAIVAYRTANGEFSKLEDIKAVHTITDSAFQRMLPYITIK